MSVHLNILMWICFSVAITVAVPLPLCADVRLPAIMSAKPVKVDDSDDELLRLLKARHNAALSEVQFQVRSFLSGTESLAQLGGVGARVRNSELELTNNVAERVAVYGKHLELRLFLEKVVQERTDNGVTSIGDLENARYWRLDAEIQLLRSKRTAAQSKTEESARK